MLSCRPDPKRINPGSPLVLEVTLTENIKLPEFNVYDLQYEVVSTSDGKSLIKFFLEAPQFVTIYHDFDERIIYGGPGDTLRYVYNPEVFLSDPDFAGDRDSENNYLAVKIQSTLDFNMRYVKSLVQKSETDFINSLEEDFNKRIADMQEYQKANGVFSDEFAKALQILLKYEIVNVKMSYPEDHAYFTNNDSFKVADTYYSFFQNLQKDIPEKLNVPSYRKFLEQYLEFNVRERISDEIILSRAKKSELKFKTVENIFLDKKIRSYLYHHVITEAYESSFDVANGMLESYLRKQTNQILKDEIKQKLRAASHLLAGNEIPNINLITVDNKEVNLSEFEGKVVYIDVWATWCGPCIRQMPGLEKLAGHYNSRKDFAILSISVDDDYGTWLQFVKKKQSLTLQLFEKENWDAPWVNHFRIESIPRFILISKEGKIADANAPGPSDKELMSLIDALLE